MLRRATLIVVGIGLITRVVLAGVSLPGAIILLPFVVVGAVLFGLSVSAGLDASASRVDEEEPPLDTSPITQDHCLEAEVAPRDAAVNDVVLARALWGIGRTVTETAVDGAVAALVAGLDNEPLRELAGLPHDTDFFDMGKLLDEALITLDPGFPTMSDHEATILAVRGYALRYRAGEMTARQLAAWAESAIGHTGADEVQPIIRLNFEFELDDLHEELGKGSPEFPSGSFDPVPVVRDFLESTRDVSERFRLTYRPPKAI